jgi:hypothetical protein
MAYKPIVSTLSITYLDDLQEEKTFTVDLPDDLTEATQLVDLSFDEPMKPIERSNLRLRTDIEIHREIPYLLTLEPITLETKEA